MVNAKPGAGSAQAANDLATRSSLAMFVTEGDMAGASAALIGGMHRALDTAARRVTAPNHPIRYLRTLYLPAEQRCIWVFEACDAATVRLVNDTAQVPFGQIAEAIEFLGPPPELTAKQ
jgi:hypothetical protein